MQGLDSLYDLHRELQQFFPSKVILQIGKDIVEGPSNTELHNQTEPWVKTSAIDRYDIRAADRTK